MEEDILGVSEMSTSKAMGGAGLLLCSEMSSEQLAAEAGGAGGERRSTIVGDAAIVQKEIKVTVCFNLNLVQRRATLKQEMILSLR